MTFSLQQASEELEINPAYLSREFSKYFDNLSFGEYMRKLRIDKAIQLMENDRYSLSEVAYLTTGKISYLVRKIQISRNCAYLYLCRMIDRTALLDNPIWSALCSDNSALGSGTDQVKLFDLDIAPFGAVKEDTPENFRELYNRTESNRVVVMFSPKANLDTLPFETIAKIPGYQMVFEGILPKAIVGSDPVSLADEDVPAMLALTQLAQPGPFTERTIAFGGYKGIFEGNILVAMAGQRLKSGGYTEISAVCTHPEHSGKGYARSLIHSVIRDIVATGNTPYLHVRTDNARAVALYHRLGFRIRTDICFYVLKGLDN
ncbi:GNAT family N-acetyltransferase [Pedobacter sp. JY14-1]|uniref:GNAT family N-acetyltransferase n=1 Tax=Pedobacter sp. JY14-1 TaxID=3034151 RepID=UPI0023E2FD76|nr:GNAT family N-acetyltransferase [Pedobacter sp. JY14-1]